MKHFEIFKAGSYPQGSFTEKDIEILADNYDPTFCESPITLDHEQSGPAYGWVSELKAENGKLTAQFKDVSEELKDFVKNGKYKKISVEIYRNLEGKKPYLKAVSFLGAAIPQVKGMSSVQFKEGESDTYIFENAETANVQAQLDDLKQQFNIFSEKNTDKTLVASLQQSITVLSESISKFQDEKTARIYAETELFTLKEQIRKDEFNLFVDTQISSGVITPTQKDTVLNVLENLKGTDKITAFKEFIKSLPKQVEFNEIATKNKQVKTDDEVISFANASEESLAIYKEAKTLADKENIPFKDALLKIYK
ncbi:MAG: hypothetical protein WCK67_11360 [bacterium]